VRIKPTRVDIIQNDPFSNDLLERKESAEVGGGDRLRKFENCDTWFKFLWLTS